MLDEKAICVPGYFSGISIYLFIYLCINYIMQKIISKTNIEVHHLNIKKARVYD